MLNVANFNHSFPQNKKKCNKFNIPPALPLLDDRTSQRGCLAACIGAAWSEEG